MTRSRSTIRRSARGRHRPAFALGLAVVLSLGLVSTSALAGAQEGDPPAGDAAADDGSGNFAVQPSGPNGPGERDWFIYTLDPGDTWGDTVAISNLSDRPTRFFIYATDAITIADTGGIGALRDDQAPVDVGSWVQLAANEYVVDPGRRIDVPFSITVPSDAEPGDHTGVILAIDADEGAGAGPDEPGVSFDVRRRIGTRIYLRVNGELTPALRIDRLDVARAGGDVTVTWDVSNTGNVRLSPTAEVRITGLFGRTVATAPAQQLAEMLPGSNLLGGVTVPDVPSYERLTAHLVLRAEGITVERSRRFGSYSWGLIGGLLALLVLLGLFIRARGRRRRTPSAPRPAAPPPKVPVSV
jgi:hypothetical protein